MNSKKLFKNNVINYCITEANLICKKKDIPEILAKLDKFDWDINPDDMEFIPLFTYKTEGDYYCAHKFKHKKLFKNNGVKLYEDVVCATMELVDTFEMVEVWLLDNMDVKVTVCCRTESDGEEGKYVTEYRYTAENMDKANGDFDIDCFLSGLQDRLDKIRYEL